jgi:hypothetical protein
MEVNKGYIPDAGELRTVYQEQLRRGESLWRSTRERSEAATRGH